MTTVARFPTYTPSSTPTPLPPQGNSHTPNPAPIRIPPQQPTLTTERLTLRPFTIADGPRVRDLASDRTIAVNTMTIPHPYPEGEAEAWIAKHLSHFEQGIGVNFAIILATTQALIGSIGMGIDQDHCCAEIGYWIGDAHRGHGYCTEAGRELLRFGFETIGLHRIRAEHFAHNPASGRVMQKLGMTYEGCSRQSVLKWGEFLDVHQYAILRSDWFAITPRS